MNEYWYMVSEDGDRAFIIKAESQDAAHAELVKRTGQVGSVDELPLAEALYQCSTNGVLELENPW